MKEQSYTNVISLVNDLATPLLPLMKKPFAFFGHTMGALIGFELARKLRRDHGLMPVQLFFSGRRAPQLPDTDPLTYNLPESEFIEELRRLKGTPETVLDIRNSCNYYFHYCEPTSRFARLIDMFTRCLWTAR